MSLNTAEKLKFIREKLNLSQKEMADRLQLQQPQYSLIERGKADFRMDKIQHIADMGVSPVWFISQDDSIVNDATSAFDLSYKESLSVNVEVHDSGKPKIGYSTGVPYYDVDFIGGFDSILNEQTIAPTYLVNFQQYNNADCWCNVTGRSMEPEISHGDIIALKEVKDWHTFLPYGEVYALVTNELRTIKKVTASNREDFFRLIPINQSPEFQPQEIPKAIIIKVFKVLGCMKKI